jgi:4-aminobutyrate aminotransferase-like enzyme
VLQFEETIQREDPATVAAVIVEPVMNVEGLIIPPASYFQALRSICDKYNVLLIYDEVITGFGRTGTMFFAEQTGAWPDLLCCGKGMSGGYAPLGATIVADKVSQVFWGDPEDKVQFNAGHTFAGNPLACATGLAVLDYIEQRHLLDHVAITGPYLADRLRALAARFPSVINVRGIGLWWGIGRAAADHHYRADRRTGRPARAGAQRYSESRLMNPLFSLDGKKALVTGAGRGIGQAVAAAFAASGADVALASRSTAELRETAAMIEAAGGKAVSLPVDLSLPGAAARRLKRRRQRSADWMCWSRRQARLCEKPRSTIPKMTGIRSSTST